MLVARVSAATAVMLGVIAIVFMMDMPAPIHLCSLTGNCILANLSGRSYFTGDSPAAPVFHLRLVFGPLLSFVGVSLYPRLPLAGTALAAVSTLAVGLPQVLGTYALMPLHPLIFVATLITFGALVWRGSHAAIRSSAKHAE